MWSSADSLIENHQAKDGSGGDRPGRPVVRWALVAVLTTIYGFFLVTPLYLLWHAHDLHDNMNTFLSEEGTNVIYRTALELRSLDASVLQFRLESSRDAEAELQRAVDVIYSRRETLVSAYVNGVMPELSSFGTAVSALQAVVAVGDDVLAAVEARLPVGPDLYNRLLSQLEIADREVADLLREFQATYTRLREELARETAEVDEQIDIAMYALLLASPIYLGGLLITNSRLSRAARAMRVLAARLRDSRNLMQAMIENTPANVAIIDREGRLILVNQRFQDFSGLDRDGLAGKPMYTLYPSPVATTIVDMERRVRASRQVSTREVEIVRPDGHVWFLEIRFPIPNARGEIDYVGCLSIDITEDRDVRDALVAAKQAAEESDKAKTRFLANMSHELRTPLNAIIGFADVMQKEMLGPIENPTYREYLGDISGSGQHLVTLIGQILDFAKIESDNWPLDDRPCDPLALVDRAARMMAPLVEVRNMTIEIVDGSDGAWVVADPRAMTQALLNLLSNATKFSYAGGRVEVGLKRNANSGFDFAVTDHGTGIDAADIPKVLQPFGQAGAAEHASGGIGLGLSITQSLIKQHGGALEILSTPGGGTTVTICLPPDRVIRTVAADRSMDLATCAA